MVEGNHITSLRNITGKKEHINADGMLETPEAKEVLRESETKTASTYIGRRQGTVAQWMDLRPIFEVCAWEPWFVGGGRRWKTWWWKKAPNELLRAMLVEA